MLNYFLIICMLNINLFVRAGTKCFPLSISFNLEISTNSKLKSFYCYAITKI